MLETDFVGRTFEAYGISGYQGKYEIIHEPTVRGYRLDNRFFIDIPIAIAKEKEEKGEIDRSDIDPYGEEEWNEKKALTRISKDYDSLILVFYDNPPFKFNIEFIKTGIVKSLVTIIGKRISNSYSDTIIKDIDLLEEISDFFKVQREATLKLIYKNKI